VGFLFARSRREILRFSPVLKPAYRNAALSPYSEAIGEDESADPLHFAATPLQRIRSAAGQEIASHTFSHYYCLEPGQTRAEFRADLAAALAIARHQGIELRSLVFPRNHVNPAYFDVLLESGITALRGNAYRGVYRPLSELGKSRLARRARLADTYINLTGSNVISWDEVLQPSGLCDVRASAFLRPYCEAARLLESLRLRRIRESLNAAARSRTIYHLWWHPHNFGRDLPENLRFLRRVLECYRECRQSHGMQSLNMAQVAASVLQPAAGAVA
jgi:hypothetical protein